MFQGFAGDCVTANSRSVSATPPATRCWIFWYIAPSQKPTREFGPAMPPMPNRAEKTVAIGFVWAISDSLSNDSLVWVRFTSTTAKAVRSRHS